MTGNRTNNQKHNPPVRNVRTIQRSNKVGQALHLPSVMNVNPRSVYNKHEELQALIIEEDIDCTFLSESWERPDLTLEQLLTDLEEDYRVIGNPHARREGRTGGRPALIIKKEKYNIKDLTNTVINIPWKVEATWAILTPKNVTQDSMIKKIIICSFYYPGPHSKVKTLLLDHLSQSYHLLTAKYGEGVHFIICGDANRLDLNSVLSLSPQMRQLVVSPTRDEAILDPIISTLGLWYQTPVCIPALQSDPGTRGATSDHQIPTMRPINMIDNMPARQTRKVTVRPLPDSILNVITHDLEAHDWTNLYNCKTANGKADIFKSEVMTIVNKIVPERIRSISSEDKPWYTEALKTLDRKRRREFHKNRRSPKYFNLQKEYKSKCLKSKSIFYKNMIDQVKESDPSRWYSMLKRISNYDKDKMEELKVEEINHLSDSEQAEAIAESFNKISQEYTEVKEDNIAMPEIHPGTTPRFTPLQIKYYLDKVKTNKSTLPGDIPAKIVKTSSKVLCVPMAHMINHSIESGAWPDSYKHELITPIAKTIPVERLDQLRPISNLPICDKIQEAVISDMVVSDMKKHLDPSQYGNQKRTSIQHYLVNMMHRIVTSVDRNSKGETNAVLAMFVDWKSAYSHQCHTLGISSFIKNGVRPSLIPLLTNYFQKRVMRVKHHGKVSNPRNQPGSGAQGATLGNQEFLSQTNENANCVPKSDRFKYVDDLTALECINLLSVGLGSYNYHQHVPSDVPSEGYFIDSRNLKTQQYINKINDWTKSQKMVLNSQKTKAMIINFTKKYQFTTRINLEDQNLEIVQQMKILGTTIDNKLNWDKNTDEIIKKVNKRMLLLKKIKSFGASPSDMVDLWKIYCRSILEQSAVVWGSSLSQKNKSDLERTQKSFLKLILKNKYKNYEDSLLLLNLENLETRRQSLSLKFAKDCIKYKKFGNMFPLNEFSG